MSRLETKASNDLILPPSVVSKVDIARLVGEVEDVDNDMTAASVRAKVGSYAHAKPTLSQQLTDFLDQNKLTLSVARDRSALLKRLCLLKESAPVIHLTFATPPDHESLEQLAQWARTSVHPQAVIAIGLQPALIAGVYVRTSNQVYDLSLRGMLAGGRGILTNELEALRGGK